MNSEAHAKSLRDPRSELISVLAVPSEASATSNDRAEVSKYSCSDGV